MRIPTAAAGQGLAVRHDSHQHVLSQPRSRRWFVQSAAGVGAAGVAIGAGLIRPSWLLADSAAAPVPIPGGSPGIAEFAGRLFHVYGPGPEGVEGLDPPNSEPATITDFSGAVGLAYISGMVRRTNRATGQVQELPYLNNDMRFMAGSYRGADGQVHEGTFAFI
jgi:hypothetical protein